MPRTNAPPSGSPAARAAVDRPTEGDLTAEGGSLATSAALIAAGMLIEPEMLGGALLGAGIVYGLPVIGKILRPVLQTAVTMGYSAAVGVTGAVNDASQELRQMLAEARSYRERHERAPEQSGW